MYTVEDEPFYHFYSITEQFTSSTDGNGIGRSTIDFESCKKVNLSMNGFLLWINVKDKCEKCKMLGGPKVKINFPGMVYLK